MDAARVELERHVPVSERCRELAEGGGRGLERHPQDDVTATGSRGQDGGSTSLGPFGQLSHLRRDDRHARGAAEARQQLAL
jgi:hypothetical protein